MLKKKKNEPPRLNKKVSKTCSIDSYLMYYMPYLTFIIFILVCMIFAFLMIMFAPGNDSAIVYNWGLK